jgi:hypothetical protein
MHVSRAQHQHRACKIGSFLDFEIKFFDFFGLRFIDWGLILAKWGLGNFREDVIGLNLRGFLVGIKVK